MIHAAIDRLLIEKPEFKIFTASIWTDPNAAVSAINFDSKAHSMEGVQYANERDAEYYHYFMSIGDRGMARLLKARKRTRMENPADFELLEFGETVHKSFSRSWEHKTNGKCWERLGPALEEIGDYTFMLIKTLPIEKDFELSINSSKDWYDKTWR